MLDQTSYGRFKTGYRGIKGGKHLKIESNLQAVDKTVLHIRILALLPRHFYDLFICLFHIILMYSYLINNK